MQNVHFNSCLKIDNKIWFITVEGYLMNLDCTTFQTKVIAPNNLPELNFKQVVDNMIFFENKIYFVEQDGSKLYEYDLITNICSYYFIPDTKYINWGCFSGIYLFNEIIYLFTRTANLIYCFDTVSKKFSGITTEKKALMMSSFRNGSKVYLYGEEIICFDMDNYFFATTYSFNGEHIYWMNQYQNTIFFLTKNQLGIWYQNDGSKKILHEEIGLADQYYLFLLTENKVFMLPNQSKKILIVDRKTCSFTYDVAPEDLYYIEKGWAKYYGYTEEKRYIWCANRVSNYLLCIDKENETTKWLKITPPLLKEEIPYLKLINKSFFYEGELSLERFMFVDNKNLFQSRSIYGKKIWGNLSAWKRQENI